MEIFETKEVLKELEQDSLITNVFNQSVDWEQIDMTEEPRSFLNKTILGKEYFKPVMKASPTVERNYIKENKDLWKRKIKTSNTDKSSSNRPTTALPKTEKFSRFFSSRNRPDWLFEQSNRLFMTQNSNNSKVENYDEVKVVTFIIL